MSGPSPPLGPPGSPRPSGSLLLLLSRARTALVRAWQAVYSSLYGSGATDRIIQWLLFNVGIALVPLISTYIISIADIDAVSYPDVWNNLPAKELLIISTALTGDALGSVVKSNFNKTGKLIAGGVCVVLLVFTTNLFAGAPSTTKAPTEPKETSFVRTVMLAESGSPKPPAVKKPNTSKSALPNPSNQFLQISKSLFLTSLFLGVAAKGME